MWKCLLTTTDEEAIILSGRWCHRLDELRDLGRRDLLACPECRQAVLVRAGEIKRPHFAHKQLKDCPYSSESPQVLQARAVLFEWLEGKFGQVVSIDQKIERSTLPRRIDCVVRTDAGNFAYWILDHGLRSAARTSLKDALSAEFSQVHWIFVAGMMKADEHQPTIVRLTTTEREFMRTTPYDEPLSQNYVRPGWSLNYLDAEAERVVTYRALHLEHPPHDFAGWRFVTTMADLLVEPTTGLIVHPGEDERRKYHEERTKAAQMVTNHAPSTSASSIRVPVETVQKAKSLLFAVHTCTVCGKQTTDWIQADLGKRTCICRDCHYGTQGTQA